MLCVFFTALTLVVSVWVIGKAYDV